MLPATPVMKIALPAEWGMMFSVTQKGRRKCVAVTRDFYRATYMKVISPLAKLFIILVKIHFPLI